MTGGGGARGDRVSATAEIRCAACGELTPAAGRFCIHCAAPLQPVVPEVRRSDRPRSAVLHAVRCVAHGRPGGGELGRPAAVSERRLVSVLFADLVGFTTLSASTAIPRRSATC